MTIGAAGKPYPDESPAHELVFPRLNAEVVRPNTFMVLQDS
jgi:hypothetical protein